MAPQDKGATYEAISWEPGCAEASNDEVRGKAAQGGSEPWGCELARGRLTRGFRGKEDAQGNLNRVPISINILPWAQLPRLPAYPESKEAQEEEARWGALEAIWISDEATGPKFDWLTLTETP